MYQWGLGEAGLDSFFLRCQWKVGREKTGGRGLSLHPGKGGRRGGDGEKKKRERGEDRATSWSERACSFSLSSRKERASIKRPEISPQSSTIRGGWAPSPICGGKGGKEIAKPTLK